jgi:AbrB family looped-hinge helix DNA binding protein
MALLHGKIPFMNAIAEIDKAGRIVVPKKMRDALHLVPGTRLIFEQKAGHIVIQPEGHGRGLVMKNGMLVYDTGMPTAPESIDWLKNDREERMDKVSGRRSKA